MIRILSRLYERWKRIHRIVIFQLPQKGIKSNYTRDIELGKIKSDLNLKILNFNIGFTSY